MNNFYYTKISKVICRDTQRNNQVGVVFWNTISTQKNGSTGYFVKVFFKPLSSLRKLRFILILIFEIYLTSSKFFFKNYYFV